MSNQYTHFDISTCQTTNYGIPLDFTAIFVILRKLDYLCLNEVFYVHQTFTYCVSNQYPHFVMLTYQIYNPISYIQIKYIFIWDRIESKSKIWYHNRYQYLNKTTIWKLRNHWSIFENQDTNLNGIPMTMRLLSTYTMCDSLYKLNQALLHNSQSLIHLRYHSGMLNSSSNCCWRK